MTVGKLFNQKDWCIAAITFGLVLAFFAPIIKLNAPRPYRHPTIVAASYSAPQGCAVRKYVELDPIALACAVSEYEFDDWAAYGLEWPSRLGWEAGRKTGTYYRVGDDLLGFQCSFGRCVVKGVERSVFVRGDAHSRDQIT